MDKNLKVTIKYCPLSPVQVDKMAGDFKHDQILGMGLFLYQKGKIQLSNFNPLEVITICSQVFLPAEKVYGLL